jgi:hypothetical protein
MNLSIELEREPGLTVSQWESFLGQGRRAGATGDSPVAEVMSTGSDDIIYSYRVEIRDPGPAAAPEQVTLPASLVQDMLNVVSEVAKSDGDVRQVVETAKRVMQDGYDNLLVPILGMNDYWIEPTQE